MSKFSQCLEKYIMRSGLTENQLAKVSGFTRSYIALMKNGQRVSPDMVKLKKLLEALNLSPYEYDEVWKAYLMARYGDRIYELRTNMISFIESFGRVSKISIKSSFNHDIPQIKTIDNRMDLEYFVKAVIEQEALKDKGYVQMIVQEDFSFLFSILPAICRSKPALRVEHIVCLEGSDIVNLEEQSYNLKTLGKLLPVLLAGNENGYEIYYYYDKVSSHFSTSALMPYLLLTSDYAINISTNLEYAMVSTDVESHQLFTQLFEDRKKICRKMLEKTSTGASIFEHYSSHRPDTEKVYTIGSQPCFGMFPVDAMVQKYFAAGDEKLMEAIIKVLGRNRETYSAMQKITSYFTKEGIRRLMAEGLVEELPREIYMPLETQDRKALLKMLIMAIKGGNYEAYMLDSHKFAFPQELWMTAYSFTKVDVIYMSDKTEARFILEEQSLARSIYDFLTDLKADTVVFSQDETLEFLEDIYSSY